MIPVDAWAEEPVTFPEAKFTPGAEKGWSAWNEWSVEVEVADFLPALIDLIGAVRVIETGCGQGYVTRRIAGHANILTFETDADLHERISRLDVWDSELELADHPTPTEEEVAEADLMICDSDVRFRVDEIRRWVEHGKPGSYLWTHDTAKHHGWLPAVIFKLVAGLPRLQFDNPRGSTLVYKPADHKVEPEVEGPQGNVFIAQIDGGTVDGAYAHSMVKAISYTMQFPGLFAGYLRWAGGPLITKARTEVVKHFLNNTDADWLLQIDSDMVFNPDLIHRLWEQAHPKHAPIVAGHCYALMAERGPVPTMWLEAEPGSPGPLIPFEGYPTDRLVPVGATGGACLMVHRSVFERLKEEMPDHPYPWFEEAYWGQLPVGEDLTFCIRARKAGFPIFVDTSLDVGHVKTQVVNREWFTRWRKSRRFVITGWGRSGTGYIADLLRRIGVTVGHEWVYGPEGPPQWNARWADSSWMAVPFLDGFDGPIIHLIRDPYKVAESLIGIRMFDDPLPEDGHRAHREFIYRHVPEVAGMDNPVEQTVRFMQVWADRLDRLNARRYRLEDLTADDVAEIVNLSGRPRPATGKDVESALAVTPTDTNKRPHDMVVDWSQQPKELTDVLDELRIRYGYIKG